jgi:uroporphyrin-III C-methyltransferase
MLHDLKVGCVLLVGAGPGPVDLMTLRAVRAVESAQALLYDALISEEAIALAPPGCIRIETGKRSGRPSMQQDAINRLTLRLARKGLQVVRLKGGDPSIFGRVGEETEFLRRFGIAVEVVPGVTAACAAAAQFGFPLTHRGQARKVIFATARVEGAGIVGDWQIGSDPEATLAIYMGGEAALSLATALLRQGRSPTTPVAIIESVGGPNAKLTAVTIAELAQVGASTSGGPLLIVIGDVVSVLGEALVDQTQKRVSA